MLKLALDLTGKPSVFLSNCHRYYNGFCGLSIYRDPPDQVISLVRLKEGIDVFEMRFEGSVNRDRIQIALRNKARKELTDLFKKVLSYLQVIATEEDIPQLLQAGVMVRGPAMRKRTVTAPAAG